MGCDIHAHFEIKVGGKWEHYDQPDIRRDYTLFERMAGVRGKVGNAISPPRGLPVDVSVTTAFCAKHMGSDGHSHSFFDAKEIHDLSEWGTKNLRADHQHWHQWDMEVSWRCYLFGNSWAGWMAYPDGRPNGVEDIRLVFWFDN